MSSLNLDALGKRYGPADVVSNVSLAIREGEFVSLLGPWGCGKTTILRMVAGLVEPSQGRILIGDDDVTHNRRTGAASASSFNPMRSFRISRFSRISRSG
jgi:ABC-type sugar transport system ATPase subunit